MIAKTQGLLIASALVLAAGGGLTYLAYQDLQEVDARLAKVRETVKDEADVRRSLRNATERHEALTQRLAHLEKGLPDAAYIPTMLKELEAVGKANGIRVMGVRPVEEKKKRPARKAKDAKSEPKRAYQEIRFEITGQGGYRDAMRFLAALNRFPKIVSAHTISIEPKARTKVASEMDRTLEFTILMRAFLFPDRNRNRSQPKDAEVALAGGPNDG